MGSDRKNAANRRNSLTSTGPRTAIGKARSSANATLHGVYAHRPVLLLAESPEEYDEHRAAMFGALAPVGYLEAVLTERVASTSWRLRRLERWEATAADAALGSVAEKYREECARRRTSALQSAEPDELELGAVELAAEREHVDVFETALTASALDGVSAAAARTVAAAALRELERLENDDGTDVRVSLAAVETALGANDAASVDWTGPLAWQALEAVQLALDDAGEKDDAARAPHEAAPAYRLRVISLDARSAHERSTRDATQARALHRKLEAGAVLNETRMESVSRYETFLERGLARTLATLRAEQAARRTQAIAATVQES